MRGFGVVFTCSRGIQRESEKHQTIHNAREAPKMTFEYNGQRQEPHSHQTNPEFDRQVTPSRYLRPLAKAPAACASLPRRSIRQPESKHVPSRDLTPETTDQTTRPATLARKAPADPDKAKNFLPLPFQPSN